MALTVALAASATACANPADQPPPAPTTFEAATFAYTAADGATHEVAGAHVTPAFFESVWTTPALGRALTGSDFAIDAEARAVVSDDFWRQVLGADPSAVGSTIVLGGRPTTIVGVLSSGGEFPADAQLWLPQPSAEFVEGAKPMELLTASSAAAVTVRRVPAGFFDGPATRPLLGRTFAESDVQPNANEVAVISHRLWHSRFSGTPDVVGQRVTLDRNEVTVIGVMPDGYDHPDDVDVWLPMRSPSAP